MCLLLEGTPPPAGQKVMGRGSSLPAQAGVRVDHWLLGPWHGARRIVSLAQRLLSSILGRSLQGLAATPIFGSDPGWLSPQNPVDANNPSTLGAFIFQSSFTERLALNSAQQQSASPPSLHGWGPAGGRRETCLWGPPSISPLVQEPRDPL